jgi:hypothetical protein
MWQSEEAAAEKEEEKKGGKVNLSIMSEVPL